MCNHSFNLCLSWMHLPIHHRQAAQAAKQDNSTTVVIMETPMKPENDVASRKNPENNTNNITQTVDERYAQPMEQKKASRKRIYNVIDAVLNHPDVCTDDADYLEEEVKRLKN